MAKKSRSAVNSGRRRRPSKRFAGSKNTKQDHARLEQLLNEHAKPAPVQNQAPEDLV